MGKKEHVNWEDVGEQLADAVNHAVSDQNYSSLNDTINMVLENAIDCGSDALRNVLNGVFNEGKGKNTGYRRDYEYKEEPSAKQAARRWQEQREQERAQKEKAQTDVYAYQSPGKYFGDANHALLPGGIEAVIGAGFLLNAASKLTDFRDFLSLGHWISFAVLGGIGGYLVYKGLGKLLMLRRFHAYVQVLGKKTYANISDLAKKVLRNEAFVVRDLNEMIGEGWFPQGHIDAEGSTFMVSNDIYSSYLEISRQRAAYEMSDAYRKNQEKAQKKQAAPGEEEMDESVREILTKGRDYLSQLRSWRESMPGHQLSEKITRMENLVEKILERAKKHPEVVPELKKMMNYYLPTTVKLLGAYREMASQPVAGENIQVAKREIEQTIDTLNRAFERLLDSIFQEQAWDVSSDISVLNTMLAQEGLSGSDFATDSASQAFDSAAATATATAPQTVVEGETEDGHKIRLEL